MPTTRIDASGLVNVIITHSPTHTKLITLNEGDVGFFGTGVLAQYDNFAEVLTDPNTANIEAPDLPLEDEPVLANTFYKWNGKVVFCRQSHDRTGFTPEDTPALFYFVRDNPEGREWIEQESVSVGNTRTWLGITYECIQAHVTLEGWEPPNVPALWQVVTSGVADWIQPTGAHDAYNIGDHVMFNGVEYESVIDANVWSPAVYPAGWAVVV